MELWRYNNNQQELYGSSCVHGLSLGYALKTIEWKKNGKGKNNTLLSKNYVWTVN